MVKVTLDMPPSFVAQRDAVIETAEWGALRYDLCFGGVFYALVDVDQIGLTIAPENARALAMTGVDLRNRIAAVEPALDPTMGGEDFSYMLEARPGAFVFIGNGETAGLHHPAYDFNDDVIPHGVSYWVKLAESRLAA